MYKQNTNYFYEIIEIFKPSFNNILLCNKVTPTYDGTDKNVKCFLPEPCEIVKNKYFVESNVKIIDKNA